MLFPPGISNAPIEQLQQFYGAAIANRMVSANDIEKRNLVDSTAAATAAATDAGNGWFVTECCMSPSLPSVQRLLAGSQKIKSIKTSI